MWFDADAAQEKGAVDRLLAKLLPSARKLFGMDVAFVSEFQAGQRIFRHVDAQNGVDLITVNASDPLEESYCQRIVDGRLPELLQDATLHPEAMTLPATLNVPVRAHLSVPIRLSSGQMYGTLCCFSRSPDMRLGHRDVATMRYFAQIVGNALEERQSRDAARQALTARLRELIDQRRYATVFQPIFDISDNRIVGYEALARFQSEPYRPPDEWFADAQTVGLQQELERTLRCDALGHLHDLPADTYLSLNVTPLSLLEKGFADSLGQFPLNRLVLEIAEHNCVEGDEQIAQVVAPLRKLGVRLAIDDAGAGYAKFGHSLKLKPDIIKLDRNLTQYLATSKDHRALAASLIQLATAIGSQVLVEGVETAAQLSVLHDLGVPLAQGYLLGRPQALPE